MAAEDGPEHTILYYKCNKDYRDIPRDDQETLLVAMTHDELRERIMNFVFSVHKE